ncbi:Uncharacterised protein [uncultured archaeon]|nr:Uncharacterised protein [uncultured archaeon]
MAEDKIIPELHDIGKLLDSNSIKQFIHQNLGIPVRTIDWNHTFLCINKDTGEELQYLNLFGVNLNESTTYKIIRYHHDPPTEMKKESPIFLACLADYMASSISRTLTNKEMENVVIEFENKTVLKLWKSYNETIKLFSSENDFKSLIAFINNVQDKEQYFNIFYKNMLNRPEDFKPPKNITSLFTHSKLVGKLYRFFEANMKEVSKGALSFGEKTANSPDDAREKWNINIITGQIKFSHYPVRVKDLNIFQILNDEISKFSQNDNVILNTSTQFLALLPPDKSITQLVKPFIEKGFIVNIEGANTSLKNANLIPKIIKEKEAQPFENSIKKQKENIEKIPDINLKSIKLKELDKQHLEFENRFRVTNYYSRLLITIDKLCEICQMQPAEKIWEDEESGITEHLCESCNSIREYRKESSAPKIEKWYQEELNSKIVWIKINLDIENLAETLQKLLDKYIQDTLKGAVSEKIELRFSVLTEFQHDFNSFLADFNKKIEEHFKTENVQPILNDFLCVKLDKTSRIKDILKTYDDLFTEYFPELKKRKSPITLSISISNVKFAFFRHWKLLDNPNKDVNVYLIGSG